MIRNALVLLGVAIGAGGLANAEPVHSKTATKGTASIRPGRYRLSLPVTIRSSNKGSPWDPNDLPDPILSVTLQGPGAPRTIKCTQKNTLTPTCLDGTEVDIDSISTIAVRIEDEDGTRNEPIATVSATSIVRANNRLGSPIKLEASPSSQVTSIALVLASLSTPSTVCNETACILDDPPAACCVKFKKTAADRH